jgi:hypothetical protein
MRERLFSDRLQVLQLQNLRDRVVYGVARGG